MRGHTPSGAFADSCVESWQHVATRDVVPTLIAGLKALEYRGYDSAGIALLHRAAGSRACARRARSRELEALHAQRPDRRDSPASRTRAGPRTARRATKNAHPHRVARHGRGRAQRHHREPRRSCAPSCCADGYEFATDTDTEVIAHLVEREHGRRPVAARGGAARDRRGCTARTRSRSCRSASPASSSARAAAARWSSASADGEQFIASDVHALLPRHAPLHLPRRRRRRRDHAATAVRVFDDAGVAVERAGQGIELQRRRGRARRVPPLHAQGDPRAAAGDRRHARGPHRAAATSSPRSSASTRESC